MTRMHKAGDGPLRSLCGSGGPDRTLSMTTDLAKVTCKSCLARVTREGEMLADCVRELKPLAETYGVKV